MFGCYFLFPFCFFAARETYNDIMIIKNAFFSMLDFDNEVINVEILSVELFVVKKKLINFEALTRCTWFIWPEKKRNYEYEVFYWLIRPMKRTFLAEILFNVFVKFFFRGNAEFVLSLSKYSKKIDFVLPGFLYVDTLFWAIEFFTVNLTDWTQIF